MNKKSINRNNIGVQVLSNDSFKDIFGGFKLKNGKIKLNDDEAWYIMDKSRCAQWSCITHGFFTFPNIHWESMSIEEIVQILLSAGFKNNT